MNFHDFFCFAENLILHQIELKMNAIICVVFALTEQNLA